MRHLVSGGYFEVEDETSRKVWVQEGDMALGVAKGNSLKPGMTHGTILSRPGLHSSMVAADSIKCIVRGFAMAEILDVGPTTIVWILEVRKVDPTSGMVMVSVRTCDLGTELWHPSFWVLSTFNITFCIRKPDIMEVIFPQALLPTPPDWSTAFANMLAEALIGGREGVGSNSVKWWELSWRGARRRWAGKGSENGRTSSPKHVPTDPPPTSPPPPPPSVAIGTLAAKIGCALAGMCLRMVKGDEEDGLDGELPGVKSQDPSENVWKMVLSSPKGGGNKPSQNSLRLSGDKREGGAIGATPSIYESLRTSPTPTLPRLPTTTTATLTLLGEEVKTGQSGGRSERSGGGEILKRRGRMEFTSAPNTSFTCGKEKGQGITKQAKESKNLPNPIRGQRGRSNLRSPKISIGRMEVTSANVANILDTSADHQLNADGLNPSTRSF
ncbi:hypothetical protein BDK51DRAFT_30192 [Blyttiomyces helicus]|uniref:Uncharacterized protein n=1 Tax=Blyttiomyces helicus TaxID=388810 RepID=A0A4P9W6S9_9FUNG|nr:hypothetical protein BDK51DRAFT_30192 [Blyttiomyces helicus]|eukprot:RKO87722.1 hypothetical protein BDK51DRAFT_30192 [Blyttiomyces helicus]